MQQSQQDLAQDKDAKRSFLTTYGFNSTATPTAATTADKQTQPPEGAKTGSDEISLKSSQKTSSKTADTEVKIQPPKSPKTGSEVAEKKRSLLHECDNLSTNFDAYALVHLELRTKRAKVKELIRSGSIEPAESALKLLKSEVNGLDEQLKQPGNDLLFLACETDKKWKEATNTNPGLAIDADLLRSKRDFYKALRNEKKDKVGARKASNTLLEKELVNAKQRVEKRGRMKSDLEQKWPDDQSVARDAVLLKTKRAVLDLEKMRLAPYEEVERALQSKAAAKAAAKVRLERTSQKSDQWRKHVNDADKSVENSPENQIFKAYSNKSSSLKQALEYQTKLIEPIEPKDGSDKEAVAKWEKEHKEWEEPIEPKDGSDKEAVAKWEKEHKEWEDKKNDNTKLFKSKLLTSRVDAEICELTEKLYGLTDGEDEQRTTLTEQLKKAAQKKTHIQDVQWTKPEDLDKQIEELTNKLRDLPTGGEEEEKTRHKLTEELTKAELKKIIKAELVNATGAVTKAEVDESQNELEQPTAKLIEVKEIAAKKVREKMKEWEETTPMPDFKPEPVTPDLVEKEMEELETQAEAAMAEAERAMETWNEDLAQAKKRAESADAVKGSRRDYTKKEGLKAFDKAMFRELKNNIFDSDSKKAERENWIKEVADKLGWEKEDVETEIASAFADWEKEVKALTPDNIDRDFPKDMFKEMRTEDYRFCPSKFPGIPGPLHHRINPAIPPEGRPKLSLEEAVAANIYSAEAYKEINVVLWATLPVDTPDPPPPPPPFRRPDWTQLKKPKISFWCPTCRYETFGMVGDCPVCELEGNRVKTKDGTYRTDEPLKLTGDEIPPTTGIAKVYEVLQGAFDKVTPFEKPIVVNRGFVFKDAVKWEPWEAAFKSKQAMYFTGFASTGTHGIPTQFKANGEFIILVKKGLDLTPYSANPWECELLLPHNCKVFVHNFKKTGEGNDAKYKIWVEQMLDDSDFPEAKRKKKFAKNAKKEGLDEFLDEFSQEGDATANQETGKTVGSAGK